MNDILSYIKLDPVYRKYHHDKLTFSLFYAFSENYILPFSHDEVVHGKHSMLDKNPGDLWQKFAGLRALYGYTMAHPGKKLLFMGGEFAHFIEWKYDDQLDWFLLVYERHAPLQSCVRQMNHLYRETPALHEVDNSWNGFQWITANDTDNSVVAFLRTDKAGQAVLCVSNFTPVFHPIYRIGLPLGGTLNEIFNTDRKEYGGSNQYNAYELHAEQVGVQRLPLFRGYLRSAAEHRLLPLRQASAAGQSGISGRCRKITALPGGIRLRPPPVSPPLLSGLRYPISRDINVCKEWSHP